MNYTYLIIEEFSEFWDWLKDDKNREPFIVILGIFTGLVGAFWAFKNRNKPNTIKNKLDIDLRINQELYSCYSEFVFCMNNNLKNKLNILPVTITTIRKWDFPTGERGLPCLKVVPLPNEPYLLISPKNNEKNSISISSCYDPKLDIFKLNLYTDFILRDDYYHEFAGMSVFLLKVELAPEDFENRSFMILSRLYGGLAFSLVTGSFFDSKKEIFKQKDDLKDIFKLVDNGTIIAPKLVLELEDIQVRLHELINVNKLSRD